MLPAGVGRRTQKQPPNCHGQFTFANCIEEISVKNKNPLLSKTVPRTVSNDHFGFFLTFSSGDKNLTGILTLIKKFELWIHFNTADRMGAEPLDHLGNNISAPNIQPEVETPQKHSKFYY